MQSLEWKDVDLRSQLITLRSENSKNKEIRYLPLTRRLLEIIEEQWRKRRDFSCLYVFNRHGRRISNFRKSWTAATEAAHKPGLLVHDLRRSAIKNMMKTRVPQATAMAISGHKTTSTFRRYHIIDTDEIRTALEQTQQYIEDNTGKPKFSTI